MLDRIDHVVLTTNDVDACISFYTRVLGFEYEIFEETRKALKSKNFKINVHSKEEAIALKAKFPTPGSLDLCFITKMQLSVFEMHLKSEGVEILEGPVERTGSLGKMISYYFNDPDGNLLEVSAYS
ncbi:VOC family virulence protein [Candidatus Aerophobetes bacterium]|uniref:VOC family virulence protein n=1 Tax=Aerophobetes bacterium TaxID=2030807 RepID=A0A2A4YMY7_UNCAE|nr:MAG: VOC family virulence protein [Candidatus Aerophobetes bacterium]